MSNPAVLIATARIRPGREDAFAAWKGRFDAALAAFPGFRSSDILPPGERDDAWTILLNFDSREHLALWQDSAERAALLADLSPMVVGGGLGEVVQVDTPGANGAGGTVTQVIFSRVRPGMVAGYREWAARMQQAQSRYPGYRGMYLQPPGAGGTHWVTILRFGTSEQLNAWLGAPERAAMLEESRRYVEGEELLRLATAFPGWVPVDPETGKGPPDWKTALLVLLGLYPIVAIELIYLNPRLSGLPPAIGVFFGNVLSVAATSFLTMPYLVHAFHGWLFSGAKQDARANSIGLAVLAAVYAAEIVLVALLFRLQAR